MRESVDTALAGFAGGWPHRPGGRTVRLTVRPRPSRARTVQSVCDVTGERRRWRILFVEDTIQAVFVLLLEAEGIEVVATGSGRKALALAAGGDFDMLITDLDLPDMPGDVVIRQVRATVKPCPRVIVLTDSSEPHRRRARDASADVVLTKPVEWAVLWSHLAPAPLPAAA